jgi:Tol biopolymer transport system component
MPVSCSVDGVVNKTWILLISAVVCASCRDAPAPFDSDDHPPLSDSGGLRLTFSLGNDRSPVWNAKGDSVYYVATGNYPGLPRTEGALVVIPGAGGVVQPILEARQVGVAQPRWFTGSAVSPSGNAIAFIELTDVAQLPQCSFSCTISGDLAFTQPLLNAGVLRVTRLGPTVATDSAALPITFLGRFFDTSHRQYNLQGTWILTSYPFQRRFAREGAHIFRPSWAPDGRRVVFSDGLRLLVWSVGAAQATPLPATVDGIWPAWSPDGQWIAFTRALRNDSTVTECLCVNERGQIDEVQRRIIFNDDSIGQGALLVIRPDGSGLRVLGEGDAPTWTPDGRLVFRRGGRLWRSAVDGSQTQPLVNTEGGWEPSVSPDGSRLAFVRARGRNADVWVVPLQISRQ